MDIKEINLEGKLSREELTLLLTKGIEELDDDNLTEAFNCIFSLLLIQEGYMDSDGNLFEGKEMTK